ncbi:AGAP009479-PA-like protein [Anopheles sinensis]|uniref:AGAP009479-PA-like protein n=1 Tax=Anopheles sinensis TaxID=74873 RepID=A0A084VPM5_ANOSI|nr:AGAP009479-PA-like protein [Anopheles sinensis]
MKTSVTNGRGGHVLCIIGLEGTSTIRPVASDGQTKDTAKGATIGPLSVDGHQQHNASSSSSGDRQRRLIPYMQYYVTSTAAPPSPPGTDSADGYQPSFNQVYNYRPINVPLREPTDNRPSYYSQKPNKPQQLQQQQQTIYRPQEDSVAYEYQSPRPAVHHRKPYYGTQAKLVPVNINPFTYEYNHRHQTPVKVDSAGTSLQAQQHSAPQPHSATSYSVLNSASSSDHGPELYERPKYAVIPREREPSYEPVPPQRFAVLPAKVYGIEIHTKSQPHPDEDERSPASGGGKFYLPNVPVDHSPSRKPALYQSVPVYKKNRINPFLPSNTIPGPFTPMTSSSSAGGSSKQQESTRGEQEGLVQVTYVKSPVTEQPSALDYQSYDHGAPVQDSPGPQSPYVLVKTVPKFYYEKPKIPIAATPTPVPYQVYYKEKPSSHEGRKQHSNHSGYTRPRIVGVVPVRISAEPQHPVEHEPVHQHPVVNPYYHVGQHLYKVPEHGVVPSKVQPVPPTRQHLTETILPQQHPQKMVVKEVVASKPPTGGGGQYFLGANYKLYKVPAKQQHQHHHQQNVSPDPAYPFAHPQLISTISNTTPKPVFYSTTPVTTAAPPVYHETPSYPMYSHSKPPRHNRTEYTDRQRFYPQSMRHPSQHKPRPIPLAPIVEREKEHGAATTASLSDLLKSLQDSNLLPRTLTPDNIDNSIRTLVKILNNLKENGHHHGQEEDDTRQAPVVPATHYSRPNYTTVEPETYVDADKYRNGPPMLINKIVSPGPNTGKPGIDYPALAEIPETSFKCKDQRYKGFFGDPETNCQVWHYCDLNGGKASFLCPNGTIFSQVALTCDWWFNVKCSTTAQLYVLNERLYKYILPFTPKFPEDYSGPLVDKYLALKFQEMEEKMKQQRAKGAKQGSIAIPSAVPDNDEVNGNTLEDNDDRYNQNQPYPIKYVTTEAGPDKPKPMDSPSSAGPITLEDIDAELQRGSAGTDASGSSTAGPSTMRTSTEDEDDAGTATSPAAANFRTSSVPTTTTFIISTEDPPNDDYREMMVGQPEGREDDDYSNVLNTEQPTGPPPPPLVHLPTAAPILSKIRRIEVKNDGTSGHLIRNPSYDRRRKR